MIPPKHHSQKHAPSPPSQPPPPFTPSASFITSTWKESLPASLIHNSRHLVPSHNLPLYTSLELLTPRLTPLNSYLWLAGLPRPARPLHRQRMTFPIHIFPFQTFTLSSIRPTLSFQKRGNKRNAKNDIVLLGRQIYITEDPNVHLVWHQQKIFLKPLPNFLFNHQAWSEYICPREDVYKSACGLLLSYTWLIQRHSDFLIAHSHNLLPPSTTWLHWTSFISEFLKHINTSSLHQVDKRYHYGEVRLSRLNTLYRLLPSLFSLHHLTHGFLSPSSWYQEFFKRHFAWLFAAFAYITVLLSAMQVGLATEWLGNNGMFRDIAAGVTVFSLTAIGVAIGVVGCFWGVLFWYSLGSTLWFVRKVERERERCRRDVGA